MRGHASMLSEATAVAPDVLSVRIQHGQVTPGRQVPYKPMPLLDRIDQKNSHHRWVLRGNKVIGALVGRNGDILFGFDQFSDNAPNLRDLVNAQAYQVTSPDDPAYRVAQSPRAVYRKSRPTDMAQTGIWEFAWPMEHRLYLQLPHPLKEGAQYRIAHRNNALPPQMYRHASLQNPSEAIHVSQIGFRPDDPVKVGFMSLWRGDGGGQTYPANLRFHLIDPQSTQSQFSGLVKLARGAKEAEDNSGRNFNLADVWQMDFTQFKRPGKYRLCVESIGCSGEFSIAAKVWQDAFYVSARGLLHQRSGIALGPPHTSYQRPRNMHPEDGLRVYHSNVTLLDSMNGLNARGEDKDNFYLLNRQRTPRILPDAWGGYADAGDWDRRAQHLQIPMLLLELLEMFPEHFGKLSLNLPREFPGLPDLLNEALWGTEIFRRLQEPDGGVRGGIESAEHTRHGEASWQESLTVMAYAPDMWSSYLYAAAGARMAHVLSGYDKGLAQTYRRSALAAMQWAETAFSRHTYPKLPHQVVDARNMAALEVFRLTGEKQWERLFLETTAFRHGGRKLVEWQSHAQSDAAFLYLRLPNADPQIKANARSAFQATVRDMVMQGERTGFRWTKENPDAWLGWGALSVPQALDLVRHHYLTGDEKSLTAALYAAQFGAGANPLNMSMTVGVGGKYPKNPLHRDHRVSNQAAPPGITVDGPHDVTHLGDSWTLKVLGSHLYPKYSDWPTTEFYLDIYSFEPVTEFTTHMTIARNAYVLGYYSARPGQAAR